jgi:hypothetical protein
MAILKPEAEAEEWIRDVYLPKEFGQSFRQKSLLLQSRGEAKFAAVSDDREVVAAICVSRGYASDGKVDTEALMKVRSDALKILWLDSTPAKRFMLFTDPDMISVVKEEKKKGHFPKEMEIVRVKLPAAIQTRLDESRKSENGEDSTHEGPAEA